MTPPLPENSEISKISENSEPSEPSEISENSENSEISKNSEISENSKNSEISENSESSKSIFLEERLIIFRIILIFVADYQLPVFNLSKKDAL